MEQLRVPVDVPIKPASLLRVDWFSLFEMYRHVVLSVCVFAVFYVGACGSDRSKAEPKNKAQAASPEAETPKTKKVDPVPSPPLSTVDSSTPDCQDPANKSDPSCAATTAGNQVRPSWLTPSLINHTKILHTGSAVVGNNTKSWVVSLELADDQTIDSCISTLGSKIGAEFAGLGEPVVGEDGRKTLRGESQDYIVSAICGINNTNKKLTAYIGVNAK